ncbi:unnamed protein product [Protopolystoma xenopodis]|uniref:Uncharacterized protein n=1 Tax=Protopolystoma xenopodis TaxID=117903 RepID=A0A3S5AMU9_9PLAT|nr:unnamed protein product [Protopolystoma xenopodis]
MIELRLLSEKRFAQYNDALPSRALYSIPPSCKALQCSCQVSSATSFLTVGSQKIIFFNVLNESAQTPRQHGLAVQPISTSAQVEMLISSACPL